AECRRQPAAAVLGNQDLENARTFRSCVSGQILKQGRLATGWLTRETAAAGKRRARAHSWPVRHCPFSSARPLRADLRAERFCMCAFSTIILWFSSNFAQPMLPA